MPKFSTTLALALLLAVAVKGQQAEPARPISDTKLTKEFICEEIVYPEEDLENKREGTVKLSFIVDAEGRVKEIEVAESVSPAIDAEAIRVFRMILWEPARRFGEPVASVQQYEFDFNTKKYKKHCKKRGYDTHGHPGTPVDSSYRIYTMDQVEVLAAPEFDDRRMTIEKFMQENLQYPEQAYRQSISGKVRLEFVVEPHGKTSNITIGQSVGGGCNEEAIRLLKLLKWKPSMKGGKAVRTAMHMDITFTLPADSDHKLIDYNRNSGI